MKRHTLRALVSWLILAIGCAGPDVRLQSPEDSAEEVASKTKLVGDIAAPYGLHPVKIEEVGLVTQLPGTGSDPPPSAQRSALVDEMQARGVRYPNHVLASGNTSLVLVRGFLRPGIQKGDHFDLEIRVPSNSETSNLRGGWLMETRLKELAVLDNQIKDGHVLGLGEGPLLVDPSASAESNPVLLGRARILGGGVALKSRPLGLVLKPGQQSVTNSAAIGAALNRRFHTFSQGVKRGVATPKTDEYIEIDVHARYKDNIERYVQVVRSVPLRESTSERAERLKLLERQLFDAVTSASAALKLEALGKDAIPVLKRGVKASDPEVRFYAAEALAYLDDKDGVPALREAAANEPAFRTYALAALSAMDDVKAHEALVELLASNSAETRYGAFRSLWAMNPNDLIIRGQSLGQGQFHLHHVKAKGQPMIHVTRSFRPEVVVFGEDQRLQAPMSLEIGNGIIVKADPARPEEISVSRFVAGEPDQKRVVSCQVTDVVTAVAEMGGTYPDVVTLLQQAKTSGALASRFEVDALPTGGRSYERVAKDSGDAGESEAGQHDFVPDNPVPGLFARRPERWQSEAPKKPAEEETPKKSKRPFGDWFGKLR